MLISAFSTCRISADRKFAYPDDASQANCWNNERFVYRLRTGSFASQKNLRLFRRHMLAKFTNCRTVTSADCNLQPANPFRCGSIVTVLSALASVRCLPVCYSLSEMMQDDAKEKCSIQMMHTASSRFGDKIHQISADNASTPTSLQKCRVAGLA